MTRGPPAEARGIRCSKSNSTSALRVSARQRSDPVPPELDRSCCGRSAQHGSLRSRRSASVGVSLPPRVGSASGAGEADHRPQARDADARPGGTGARRPVRARFRRDIRRLARRRVRPPVRRCSGRRACPLTSTCQATAGDASRVRMHDEPRNITIAQAQGRGSTGQSRDRPRRSAAGPNSHLTDLRPRRLRHLPAFTCRGPPDSLGPAAGRVPRSAQTRAAALHCVTPVAPSGAYASQERTPRRVRRSTDIARLGLAFRQPRAWFRHPAPVRRALLSAREGSCRPRYRATSTKSSRTWRRRPRCAPAWPMTHDSGISRISAAERYRLRCTKLSHRGAAFARCRRDGKRAAAQSAPGSRSSRLARRPRCARSSSASGGQADLYSAGTPVGIG